MHDAGSPRFIFSFSLFFLSLPSLPYLLLTGFLLRLMAIEKENKTAEVLAILFTTIGMIILILSVGISLYNDF